MHLWQGILTAVLRTSSKLKIIQVAYKFKAFRSHFGQFDTPFYIPQPIAVLQRTVKTWAIHMPARYRIDANSILNGHYLSPKRHQFDTNSTTSHH